jgi:hypothetical protein
MNQAAFYRLFLRRLQQAAGHPERFTPEQRYAMARLVGALGVHPEFSLALCAMKTVLAMTEADLKRL